MKYSYFLKSALEEIEKTTPIEIEMFQDEKKRGKILLDIALCVTDDKVKAKKITKYWEQEYKKEKFFWDTLREKIANGTFAKHIGGVK